MKRRFVVLDRDGTIIAERHYLSDPRQIPLLPGSVEGLRRMLEMGLGLVVITNQSGVGWGLFTMAEVETVNAYVAAEFAKHGVAFEKIYVAPEAPDQPSRGRKPSPQFLFDARDEFGVNLARSYMVGDKLIDMECGWNAGVERSILVRTGYGAKTEQEAAGQITRVVVVNNLPAGADWILRQP